MVKYNKKSNLDSISNQDEVFVIEDNIDKDIRRVCGSICSWNRLKDLEEELERLNKNKLKTHKVYYIVIDSYNRIKRRLQ